MNVVLTPLKNYQPPSYNSNSILVYDDTNESPENEAIDNFGPFTFEPDVRSQSLREDPSKKKRKKKTNMAKRMNPVDIFNTNAARQGNKKIMRHVNSVAGTPPTPLNLVNTTHS